MWIEISGQEVYSDLMQMSYMSETMDQLAKANFVRWHGHVLIKNNN